MKKLRPSEPQYVLSVGAVAEAVEIVRATRGIDWEAVGREIGCLPGPLADVLTAGGPLDADTFCRLLVWMDLLSITPFLHERRLTPAARPRAEQVPRIPQRQPARPLAGDRTQRGIARTDPRRGR